MPARATARMAAFIPGASPPLVSTAIFFIVPPGASRATLGQLHGEAPDVGQHIRLSFAYVRGCDLPTQHIGIIGGLQSTGLGWARRVATVTAAASDGVSMFHEWRACGRERASRKAILSVLYSLR